MKRRWLVGHGLLVAALGCKPDPSAGPEAHAGFEVSEREPPPVVDHGLRRPYWGTWIGPKLRLSFAGPWVLIVPHADIEPGAQPIELRASVERQAGDAFALRTTLVERYAAEFVRPSDWTMLVEAGGLAIAMGDEPLTTYVESDQAILIGPAMLDTIAIPETIAGEQLLACLEFASVACRELEADGPLAAGCRESQWAVCVAHLDRGQADPTVRAAIATARSIHADQIALRFAEGLLAAAPEPLRAEAEALHQRALTLAAKQLAQLRKRGPLPSNDPHLPDLLAALRAAGLEL